MACRCATVPPASIAFFLILFFSPPFPSPPLARSQVTHSLGPLSTLLSASSSLPDLSLFSSSSSRARSAVSPCLRPSAGRGSLSLSVCLSLSLARVPTRSAPSSRLPPPRPSSRSLFPASFRRARRDRPLNLRPINLDKLNEGRPAFDARVNREFFYPLHPVQGRPSGPAVST